ncbi:hypothetical protein BUY77_05560 [Staphylococcus equorum]|uniref:DUF2977 domain-containing protein n=1 Tax=Staphylococcus equorum TaxID=246432 RepID=UPI000D1CAC90|nr:DUF2977 domain-containing protein [Staphylococcus equorum]PTE43363.1 hypothetical protein BUY77_05560 [Staphylococcus equorum]
MKIKLNETNEITDYARVGNIVGSIDITDEELPYNFFSEFHPRKFIYDQKLGIIENNNFELPSDFERNNISGAENQIEVIKKQVDEVFKTYSERIKKIEDTLGIKSNS